MGTHFLRNILLILSISFVASCKIVDRQIIFPNDETVPLPESIVFITIEEDEGEVVTDTFPVATRISPNQYRIAEGDEELFILFEKLRTDEDFWIMQFPQDKNEEKFLLILATIQDDKIIAHLPQAYRDVMGTVNNREQMHTYFEEVSNLDADRVKRFPTFIFDATQPDPQGDLLRERVAEALSEGEQFFATLNAEKEALRLASEAEEERLRKAQEAAERAEREAEAEREAQAEAERQRLLAEQNEAAADKEIKVISFSDRTELAFCISESTIMSSVQAASEQSYFTFMNRLSSLREERLCTARLSMENIEEMNAAVEMWEVDPDNGRIFMIGSVARSYFTNCSPCDDLRSSDRMYFVAYNEVGGDQYGWKGYEQFIVENRTVGGIIDFLLTE